MLQSRCCRSPLLVEESSEGICYYVCDKCQRACEAQHVTETEMTLNQELSTLKTKYPKAYNAVKFILIGMLAMLTSELAYHLLHTV